MSPAVDAAASISMSWVMMGLIGLLVSIVGFFVSQKMKKLDKVDNLDKTLAIMGTQLEHVNKSLSDFVPAFKLIYDVEKSQAAAWRRIDEHNDELKLLRKRTHDMANWIMIIRGKMAVKGENFAQEWNLPEGGA